jgi:acyl-CoA synthetase (AMP-forming)/AMP-acid ligase II
MTPLDTVFIPRAGTVPEAIAWWTATKPDAPALKGLSGDANSYAHLHTRIEAFARQLSALGIERSDRVLLALPDGVAAAIAGLATIRTAVGVPVNPTQSPAEVDAILATVAPRVVIVAQAAKTAFREVARHANIPVVTLRASFKTE